MWRQGFCLEGEGAEALEDAWKALAVREKGPAVIVQEAHSWGRLYGGAAVLLGMDGDPATPAPANGTIRFLLSVAGGATGALIPDGETYKDPRSPMFGLPVRYRLSTANGQYMTVHESRLVLFGGLPTTPIRRQWLGGWDDSVLMPAVVVLQLFAG